MWWFFGSFLLLCKTSRAHTYIMEIRKKSSRWKYCILGHWPVEFWQEVCVMTSTPGLLTIFNYDKIRKFLRAFIKRVHFKSCDDAVFVCSQASNFSIWLFLRSVLKHVIRSSLSFFFLLCGCDCVGSRSKFLSIKFQDSSLLLFWPFGFNKKTALLKIFYYAKMTTLLRCLKIFKHII